MRFILLLAVLLPCLMFSKVVVKLSKHSYILGEQAVLSIVSDEDIKRIGLSSIAGYGYSGGRSVSTTSINGKVTTKYRFFYAFYPTKSFSINPFYIMTSSGHKFLSGKLSAKVVKPKPLPKGHYDNSFSVYSKSKSYFKGDIITITVRYISSGKNLVRNINYIGLVGRKNLSFVGAGDVRRYRQGGRYIEDRDLKFVANKVGKFHFDPISIEGYISHNGGAGFFMSQSYDKKMFVTNGLDFSVRALPAGVTLYGKNLNMKLTVDRTAVSSSKPVNAVLTITGNGNFKNVGKISLGLENQTVYTQEPVIKKLADGSSVYEIKYSILSDLSFTIKPVVLKYLDEVSSQVKVLKTEPININIVVKQAYNTNNSNNVSSNSSNNVPLKELKPTPQKESNVISFGSGSLNYVVIAILVIIILFLLLIIILRRNGAKNRDSGDINSNRVNINNQRDVFRFLLKYTDSDPEARELVSKLSENIYENGKNKIDKSKLKDVVTRLKGSAKL